MSPRLVILDDDATIVAVVRRYFEGRGWQVEARLDAAEALARVTDDEPFDAVLCDLHFTKARLGEGLPLLERARQRHPRAAVLLFTGTPEAMVREEALRRGADDVLIKPTPLARLHDAVLRAMKKT